MPFNVIDFFCGCGGTSAGLRAAGMNIVAGIDFDSKAIETYKLNFPEAMPLQRDVRSISEGDIEQLLESCRATGPLVFSACAPCQPFSAQNRYKSADDQRVCLLDELHRFVKKFLPDYILLENVPGMQKVLDGPFPKFLSLLTSLGYQSSFGVLNAVDYGVPQNRRRLVLLAARGHGISLPKAEYGKGLKPYRVVRDAISHYPPIEHGSKSDKVQDHEAARLTDLLYKRIAALKPGQDRRSWPDELKLKCHARAVGHSDVYGRLDWDKPSVTLTTKCISLSNGRFGHPSQNRAISAREAAALQTFPEDFVFTGSIWEKGRQIGNAVPVLFAKALGLQIIRSENGKY
jgi:DNA (cytosine-5)-methyltransferase 1